MNVLKKQLRLPGSFSGMRKATSTTNLSDNHALYGSTHNLTQEYRFMKSKSPAIAAQEILEALQSLSTVINDKPNKISSGNFVVDDLPTTLSTEWLTNKYSVDHTKQMQQKTSAIIELLTTELNYLNQMQFLLDISHKIFTEIQSKYFPYIQVEDVFLNLGDIYEVNYRFWLNYFYPSYEIALNNNEFISTKYWKEGFNDMASLFCPYQVYCAKMIQCQRYIQALERDNKCFSQFSQWFSRLDQANRESLTDFIAKPFQRLTKYKLLLNTIGKFSEDIDELNDIEEMGDSVNLFLKQVELKISIAQISMRIDPTEIVEPPIEDLSELCMAYKNLDLTAPIRTNNGVIIREMKKDGVFKFKEAQTKVFEVSCLLFTDLILICQKIKNPETDRIKIIRPIISLRKSETSIHLPGALVIRIIDDFGCLSAMYLLTSEPCVIIEWIEAIQCTKMLLKDVIYQYNDTKTYLKPQLNVISSSPIPEGNVTPPSVLIPATSISPQTRTLSRSSVSHQMFTRSNIRSSPVMRKEKTVVKRNHLSLSEEQPPHDILSINRSLSQQHSTKSYLSILEDEYDDPCISNEFSLHNVDFQSSNHSIQSESTEYLEAAFSQEQTNNLNPNNDTFHPNVKVLTNYKTVKSLKDNRLHRSMVNLLVN